jgi:hypothetical protein
MGGTCSTHVKGEKCLQIIVGLLWRLNLKGEGREAVHCGSVAGCGGQVECVSVLEQ